MTISPTLSTVEVIPAAGGNLPDGTAAATLRVTARTTANAAPSATCQVKVSVLTGGQHTIDHEYRWVAGGSLGMEFSYASAGVGIAEIPVRSQTAGTARYLVEIGEDDGSIAGPATTVSLNGLIAKPERDIAVGRTISGAYAATYTTAQTIDEAWLSANAPTRTIDNVLFAAPVTLAFDSLVGDIEFRQCVFSTLTSETNSLVTQGRRFSATNCGLRGSGDACVEGEGGTFDRCSFDGIGKHAVHIEQSGSSISPIGQPDDFTPTRFLSCLFRRIGIVTPGYALYGTPMRNVTADHCWFDLAGAGASEPQTVGSVLACVRQVTTADGARGPFLYGCWIGGGVAAYVEVETGASSSATQFATVYGCRFADLGRRGSSGCVYVKHTGTQTSARSHGNLVDDTGILISNATHALVNTEAGPRNMWPRVALVAQPEVTWQAASGGGTDPGGSGGGPITPTNPGQLAPLGESLLFRLQNRGPEPLGSGGGARVIRKRRVIGAPQAATPVLVGDGTTTPPVEDPLYVVWSSSDTQLTEGGEATVFAQLFTSSGAQPISQRLVGFEVPVTVQYVAFGSAVAGTADDFVIPATVSFAPGASVGRLVVRAYDDTSVEGAESCRITLGQLTGLNPSGETVILVEPGDDDEHHVVIAASDVPAPSVSIFVGTTAVSVNEGFTGQSQLIQIPIRVSGNPSQNVPFRVTLTGTATLGVDYTIVNPTVAGSPNVVQMQFSPTATGETPGDLPVVIRLAGDATYEPDETIIFTLTSPFVSTSVATVGASVATVTVTNDDAAPTTPPSIGWAELAISMYEAAGTSTPTVRNVGIESRNGQSFSSASVVNVEVVDVTAEFGVDYTVFWSPPNPGTMVGLVGQVPFSASQFTATVQVRPQFDVDIEGEEQFLLRILPGDGYTVDATRNELLVTLRDPVQGGTRLFVERIQGVTSPTLVSATLYATSLDLSAGITMEGPAGSTNCQYHPLSYRPDGTPDTVRVWGLLGPSGRSVPNGAEAIVVRGGSSVEPTPPINIATQLGEVVASGLKLTLNHDVNGETRDFSLPIVNSGASFSPLIDTGNVSVQGDGPRLFGRYRVTGELVAGSGTSESLDRCTVARVYLDCRADLDVVVVAINWGNYRWKKPDGTFTHYTANPAVDGEVFFKHLWLENIPAGWAATLLDPNTTRSEYDAGNSRVQIIKPLGGAQRHYLPPLRGHVAYIALYKTASVTETIAREVLLGHDHAYAVGGLGLDQNDAIGEHGLPGMNYGEGSIPWVNGAPNQAPGTARAGWDGSEDYSKRERDEIRNHVTLGTGDRVGVSHGRVGWWHGFDIPEGGAPSGLRIALSGGTMPGKWGFERNALEMIHLWHRVGGVAWTQKAVAATDEDFCVESGSTYVTATATWIGIGGQRMGHQHFYVPDYEDQGSGRVASASRIGPGRTRARGYIQLVAQPSSGDDVVVSDGVNAARTFRFGTGTDTATLKHVAIGSSTGATITNLKTVMNTAEGSTTLAVNAFFRQVQSNTLDLIARYAGTGANVTITTTAPTSRIVVSGMSGGSNGTNVRLWNYLVHGTNTSQYTVVGGSFGIDVTLGWHNRGMDVERSYHSFDWSHMARMNRVLWDGWWLYFDPIAYDIATDLMHLGTHCLGRYRPDPASPWLSGAWTSDQLVSTCTLSNLPWIYDGHNDSRLLQYIQNGHDSRHPWSTFQTALAQNQGRNCGTWAVRNPTVALASFNPTLSYHFNLAGEWAIGRAWGWLMATVARGYAIDPALRPDATKFVQRTRLHPATSTAPFSESTPSWFECVRVVMALTAHKSGASSSQDVNGANNLYSGLGAPDFVNRSGSVPGGSQNDVVAGQSAYDDEWYANQIAWQEVYVSLGSYAVLRRVYDWADRTTTPSASGLWVLSMGQQLRFGKLLMLSARDRMGPVQYHIPTFHVVGVGNPATAGTASSIGKYGRFNSETGAANPNITFRSSQGRVWWWAANFAVGDSRYNYYFAQYMLWALINQRVFGDTEVLGLFPGLVGAGGGTAEQGAQGVVTYLMADWEAARRSQTEQYGERNREAHYIIQWARNELGAT